MGSSAARPLNPCRLQTSEGKLSLPNSLGFLAIGLPYE